MINNWLNGTAYLSDLIIVHCLYVTNAIPQ
jgi:hypothetical protein